MAPLPITPSTHHTRPCNSHAEDCGGERQACAIVNERGKPTHPPCPALPSSPAQSHSPLNCQGGGAARAPIQVGCTPYFW
jgi:hypothetical protein